MILILDITSPNIPLLKSEFVWPVKRIVEKNGVQSITRHITEYVDTEGISGCIICGTALADTWYLSYDFPEYLAEAKFPVLGICAGMQLLIQDDGGDVIPAIEIGMTEVFRTRDDPLLKEKESFLAYALHQFAITLPETWTEIARSDTVTHIARKNNDHRYGVLFHPEVRNEWLIINFLSNCQ